MEPNTMSPLTRAAARFVLAFVLVFTQAGWAAQKETGSKAPVPRGTSQETKKEVPSVNEAAGPHEGIKVHGQWIIEIREPNGKLVTRREFENALSPFASPILTGFLGRNSSVGKWNVLLFGNPISASPCLDSVGSPVFCEVSEVNAVPPATFVSFTLTIANPTSGPNAGALVLSGTAIAQNTASAVNIGDVRTTLGFCAPSASTASACAGLGVGVPTISLTTLASPIPVSAGQQILVTVVITFS